jgi:hypothetical protein
MDLLQENTNQERIDRPLHCLSVTGYLTSSDAQLLVVVIVQLYGSVTVMTVMTLFF